MNKVSHSARLAAVLAVVTLGLAMGCSSADDETAEASGEGTGGRAGGSLAGGAAGASGLGGAGAGKGGGAGGGDDPVAGPGGAAGQDDAGGAAGQDAGGAGGSGEGGAGGDDGEGGAAGQASGGAPGSAGKGGTSAGGAGAGGSSTGGLPDSKRFNLDDASDRLFWKKELHDPHHLMQGFAVDQKNGRMYFAQLRDGGSGDDLCITETDMTGKETGHMYHDNAGHGVSIGVESVGKDSYLWVETDSHKNDDTGRGTAMLRFKFQDGKKPAGKKFLTGSSTITAATDPINQRIVIRRREDGQFVYRLFTLAAAAAGDFSKPLAKFTQPALSTKDVTFQGYTIFGQYLYTLDGTGHDDADDINSYVTRIDMKTGKVDDRALTKAGVSLIFREPEGMAVYQAGGETRLCIGLGSHDKVGGSNRWANVYYKNALIP